jgi:hypothetical protein
MGSFRAEIEAVVLTPDEVRKSSAGRKPIDAIVLFRMLVLQALNNLSDDQAEYQVRDRLSFTRFLRLGIEDSIPDATTLWLCREKLAKAGLIEKLFDRFDQLQATRNHSLSEAQANANRNRSKFALASSTCSQLNQTALGGRIVRTIGIVRARAKIGLQNLAYNIRRLVMLEQIAAA